MKKIFYFLVAFTGIVVGHSCSDFTDADGDPLVDNSVDPNEPRALFREVTDADTIAEYKYNGLLLSEVHGPKTKTRDRTVLSYSGDKISSIAFNGRVGTDSIVYNQNFNYGINDRIETVSETRYTFDLTTTTPPPPVKTKTLYTLKYNTTGSSRMDSLIMKTGVETVGTPHVYTTYSKSGYTYSSNNVTNVVKKFGALSANGTVFDAPGSIYSYDYTDYDTKINPHTLLPYAYKVSVLMAKDAHPPVIVAGGAPFTMGTFHSTLSANNPQKLSVAVSGIINPFTFHTYYQYDPQNYMTKGFGIYYFYKPM